MITKKSGILNLIRDHFNIINSKTRLRPDVWSFAQTTDA